MVKIETLPVISEPSIPEEEEVVEEKEEEKPAFEKKELNWEEDMMLFSKYLDRKVRTVRAYGRPTDDSQTGSMSGSMSKGFVYEKTLFTG